MEADQRGICRLAPGAGQHDPDLKELLLAMPAVGLDVDFERPRARLRRLPEF
jgi:hypothetical protein